MKVEHFFGTIDVNDISKLKTVIEDTTENANEFWLSGINSYPCLCISTNNGLAHVHYFMNEDTVGFQAIGNLNITDDIVTFYTNNSGEKIEIEKEYVVPMSMAIEIATEFFVSQNMPKCVNWEEL